MLIIIYSLVAISAIALLVQCFIDSSETSP